MKPSLAWALVGTQFGLLAALVLLPSGGLWGRGLVAVVLSGLLIAGGLILVALAGFGLGRSLTALPIPKNDGQLVTTGLYRWVRHPIYTGVVLAALGLVVAGASVAHLVGFLALYVVLMTKAQLEEKLLAERYEEYEAYAQRTGRFFPRWSSAT